MRSRFQLLSKVFFFNLILFTYVSASIVVNDIKRTDATNLLRIRDVRKFDLKNTLSHVIPSETSNKLVEFESFFERSMKGSYWSSPNSDYSCPDYNASLEYEEYILEYVYTVQTTIHDDPANWVDSLEDTFQINLFKMISKCSESGGIATLHNTPRDEVLSDKSCFVTEPGAKSCTVMQGQLTLVSTDISSDDKNDALQAIIDGIYDNKFLSTSNREIIKIDIYIEDTVMPTEETEMPKEDILATSVSCPNYDSNTENRVLNFKYSVQTSIEDDPVDWRESLEYVMLETISEYLLDCPSSDFRFSNMYSDVRNLSVDGCSSVNSAPVDVILGDKSCAATELGSKSCIVMQGQLTITAADLTDEKMDVALQLILDAMNNNEYIDERNPEVIKVEQYAETTQSAATATTEENSNLWGLLIALIAFLILLICASVITKMRRSQSDEKDLDFDMTTTDDDTLDLGDESPDLPTAVILGDDDNWVNDVEGYQDNDHHEIADFNNLGKNHSNLNVHKCNSVLCGICLATKKEKENAVCFESVHSSKYRDNDESKII